MTAADGRIYAIGGASKHNRTVKTVEVYDIRADSWSRAPSLCIARRGPGVALGLDGRLYAIGGYGATRGGPLTADTVVTVETYDPATRRWGGDSSDPGARIQRDRCRDGIRRANLRAVGRIYATGDIIGGSLVVHAYDPRTDVWQQVSSPDRPRSGFGAALGPDGRIYLAGGVPESRLVAYEPSADAWQELEAMPADRWMVAATTGTDGRIYVVGGYAANQLVDAVDANMA